ncbi:hypothetical protein M011DRAFT_475731 [Sporormia fimetaria CBS 119925]|uniref:Zn(2)-C6 fungal-type domain-containing protein n=1 Tax=Sporormia fimetaria CBS 119925 TaxID=1340428 RepID=A0A6A6VEH3_9PLEO|nr:hypothetical protein M011DRAFT_475731 [Sporormia fimetaria CBS 119925]
MAASSHSTDPQRLPYDAFPGDPDNNTLYAGLTPWSNSQGFYDAPGQPSTMFRRPEPSSYPTTHAQYTSPYDFAGLQHVETAWAPGAQYRTEVLPEDPLTTRAIAYPQGSSSTAPGSRPAALASDAHVQSQEGWAAHRPYDPQAAPYDDAPNARTLPTSVSGLMPVAHILNDPSCTPSSLQSPTHELSPQTPMQLLPPASSLLVQAGREGYPSQHPSTFPPTISSVTDMSAPTLAPWNAGMHGQHLAPAQYPCYSQTAAAAAARRSSATSKLPKVPSPFLERQKKNKASVRHGPLSRESREKAHKMRGPEGKRPCIRCRFYKAGCDEGEICMKCEKTRRSARVFLLPCTRDQIEDTNLVRRCNGRFAQPEADFVKYPWKKDRGIHVMDIVWYYAGYGPVSQGVLQIKFCEYEPEGSPINSTESQWRNTNGQLIKVEQPPFAVYDTVALQNDVEVHFSRSEPSLENWIFGRNQHDTIALLTYKEALRLRSMKTRGSELINLALRLQYLSVISQGYGSVCTNIPGIKQYDYRQMGHSEYEAYDRNSCDRPLPIAINHQFDVALVKLQKRVEERFFKLLAKTIFQNGIRPWYELFITFFILFWNLEYIHSGAEGYMRTKSGTHVGQQVNTVVSQQLEKWDFSFQVLMNHWQGLLRGYKPFMLARENPEELRIHGKLPDHSAFVYMTNMAAILDDHGPSQFPPPLTGFAPTTNSRTSRWITALLSEAGGLPI